jgi:hypothetical protein
VWLGHVKAPGVVQARSQWLPVGSSDGKHTVAIGRLLYISYCKGAESSGKEAGITPDGFAHGGEAQHREEAPASRRVCGSYFL